MRLRLLTHNGTSGAVGRVPSPRRSALDGEKVSPGLDPGAETGRAVRESNVRNANHIEHRRNKTGTRRHGPGADKNDVGSSVAWLPICIKSWGSFHPITVLRIESSSPIVLRLNTEFHRCRQQVALGEAVAPRCDDCAHPGDAAALLYPLAALKWNALNSQAAFCPQGDWLQQFHCSATAILRVRRGACSLPGLPRLCPPSRQYPA